MFLSLSDIVIYCDIVHFTSLPGNNSLLTIFLHCSNWPSGSLSTPLSVCLKRGCPKLPFYFGVGHTQMEVFFKGDPPVLDTPKYQKSNNPLISRLKTRRPRCGYPWHRVSTNWYVPAWGKKTDSPQKSGGFPVGKISGCVEVLSEFDNQNLSRKTWNGWSHLVHHLIFQM